MSATSNETKESLQGRVVLVTGAAKRIGRAVAVRLAAEGADVVIHYNRSKSEAEDAVAEIVKFGRKSIAIQADLCSLAQIKRLFQQIVDQFGRLDILINSAANFLPAHLDDTTEKMWDTALDTNLKAPFFCAQAAAPLLKQSRGVIMLTKCLARALAPEVRVNAIAPGTITMSGDPTEWEADFIRRAPLHRTGTPEDAAEAVSYLVDAKFVTGQVLILDGGRTL